MRIKTLIGMIVTACATCVAQERSELPLPEVPSSLVTPEERARYVVTHFWDALDINDTTLTRNTPLIEQSFVNFISILPIVPDSVQRRGIDALTAGISSDPHSLHLIKSLADKYLYEMQSPMRDDMAYAKFLEFYATSPATDEADRTRAAIMLELVMKNRVGTRAPDFAFQDRDGRQSTLYTAPTSGKILLMFYDPTCEHCTEVTEALKTDRAISEAVADGSLSIIAIYCGDNAPLWQRTASSLPASWIVGHNDGSIEEEDLYDFRTMPTLYLLSPSRTVELKELPFPLPEI